ncbi:MAG TPA: chemotaxis protein CheW [Gammaproteobacteria bacterium]|nr:chemotaxis protein CheW [Gammaproteobacteria bacterium]
MTTSTLAELRDRPFELLLEIERRSRLAAAGLTHEAAIHAEWIGVGFRMGDELLVAAREEVKEILTYPEAITRIPGAKGWLRGLANVRGQLLPVTDLAAFFGGPETVPGRATRVLVVNHAEIPAGLIVDEVRGFRRFTDEERVEAGPTSGSTIGPYLGGAFRRGDETWKILNLRQLVESQLFLQAAQ